MKMKISVKVSADIRHNLTLDHKQHKKDTHT